MRPRIRTLKPEVWADERVGDLSHGARLLFIGLITMADDDGRLRELPAAILGHIFPYDDVSHSKLTRWLGEIEATGMIVRYMIGRQKYVAFRRWSRHQKVDRGRDSVLPPPESFDVDSSKTRRSDPDSFDDDSRSPRAGADPIPSLPGRDLSVRTEKDDARELFDYWRQQCGHDQAKPTRDRLAKIRARLHEGYSAQQVREAIDGAARGAFVNDRGTRFDDIELICRNGSKLESFVDRATSTARGSVTDLDQKRMESARRLMTERGVG